MGKHAYIRGIKNEIVGVWFQDPTDANPEMLAIALESGLARDGGSPAMSSDQVMAAIVTALSNHRVVPNKFNNDGGCFVMIGSTLAPGERKPVNNISTPSNSQRTTQKQPNPAVGCSWYMKLFASILIGFTIMQLFAQILIAVGANVDLAIGIALVVFFITASITYILLGKMFKKVPPQPATEVKGTSAPHEAPVPTESVSLSPSQAASPAASKLGAGPRKSGYEWSYFEHKSSGVRFPYPKNWIAKEQSGKIMIHGANPRLLSGGILEIGMTLALLNTSNSPLAGSDDTTMCKRWMETMLKNSSGIAEWSEEGKLASGQPALWFGYRFRSAGVDLKAVCAVAHTRNSLYYLDVTGLADLIDGRLDEWKSIVHALEVRK